MLRAASDPIKDAHFHHDHIDPHRKSRWLSDAVLGGQDGVVNVLGVVLGMAAASASTHLLLVAGFATAIAEAFSMAAVAYTSSAARGDLFKAERAREYRHINVVPELERDEVRTLYASKGFSGPLLDRIVDTITQNRDVWVAVMMAEEHRLADTSTKMSLRSAAVVGLSSLVGSLVPLGAFLWLPVRTAAWVTVLLSAIALFAFGVYKAKATVGRPLRSGIELAAIGVVTALLGFVVGALFTAVEPH